MFHLVSHRISLDLEGLARIPGSQEFQDPFPFLSKMPSYLLCLQAGRVSGQCPGQKQVRDLLSFFWKLSKTSSILISLPGTWKLPSNFIAESETISFSRKARFQPDIIFYIFIYLFIISFFFFLFFFFIRWRLITLQYCSGFYHTLTWISHGFTCVPHSYSPLPNRHYFLNILSREPPGRNDSRIWHSCVLTSHERRVHMWILCVNFFFSCSTWIVSWFVTTHFAYFNYFMHASICDTGFHLRLNFNKIKEIALYNVSVPRK